MGTVLGQQIQPSLLPQTLSEAHAGPRPGILSLMFVAPRGSSFGLNVASGVSEPRFKVPERTLVWKTWASVTALWLWAGL